MPFSSNLWDTIEVPAMWVELAKPVSDEADQRSVVIRIKESGKRSVRFSIDVSRYAPEASIFRAISMAVAECATLQVQMTPAELRGIFAKAFTTYVDPF
jgi:hypothetical protein